MGKQQLARAVLGGATGKSACGGPMPPSMNPKNKLWRIASVMLESDWRFAYTLGHRSQAWIFETGRPERPFDASALEKYDHFTENK